MFVVSEIVLFPIDCTALSVIMVENGLSGKDSSLPAAVMNVFVEITGASRNVFVPANVCATMLTNPRTRADASGIVEPLATAVSASETVVPGAEELLTTSPPRSK